MTVILEAAGPPSLNGDAARTSRHGMLSPQPGENHRELTPPVSDDNGRASAIAPPGQGRVVLVVDDEPTVRLLITEVLQDLEYKSLEAVDGPSGLQILRSDAPIDLLITDVGLPGGMDGRRLAAAARLERPGLAILFITGYAETAAIADGVLQPGMKVLGKPFSINVLASHIKELTALSA